MMSSRREVRLPSLASVAGPDIFSLDLRAGQCNSSNMQAHSGFGSNPRHRTSNSELWGSQRSSGFGFDSQGYNDSFAGAGTEYGLPPPLPPLGTNNSSYRRLRKHSSSSSLSGFSSPGGYNSTPTSYLQSDTFGSLSTSSRNALPPLPPLGSLPSLPPMRNRSGLQPFQHSFGQEALENKSQGFGDIHHGSFGRQNSSVKQKPLSIAEEQEWDGFPAFSSSGSFEAGNLAASSADRQGLPSSRRLRRRGSAMDLNAARDPSFGLGGGLSAPFTSSSLFPSTSTNVGVDLSTSNHDSLGMLPMPAAPRASSRSGTGHIVLTTDYRIVRLSHNILIWLGLSSTSMTAAGSAMTGIAGQPLSSLVAPSDQLVFGDYLADLHAERRKAEKTKLHSLSSGGDGTARGVCKSCPAKGT